MSKFRLLGNGRQTFSFRCHERVLKHTRLGSVTPHGPRNPINVLASKNLIHEQQDSSEQKETERKERKISHIHCQLSGSRHYVRTPESKFPVPVASKCLQYILSCKLKGHVHLQPLIDWKNERKKKTSAQDPSQPALPCALWPSTYPLIIPQPPASHIHPTTFNSDPKKKKKKKKKKTSQIQS